MTASYRIALSALFALAIATVSSAQDVSFPMVSGVGSSLGAVSTSADFRTRYTMAEPVSKEYFEVQAEDESQQAVAVAKDSTFWADCFFFVTLGGLAAFGFLVSARCIYMQRHPRVPKLVI